VPDRPLRVLDLGAGTGSSTAVLAFWCPAGSQLTGYELAEPLLVAARRRRFTHRSGVAANVDFVCQGVAQPLRQADGSRVPDRQVDVVNASGVVGHHLNADTIAPLVAELQRTIAAEGIAQLDVGPTLRDAELTRIMTAAGFRRLGRFRSWWLDPTGQVVYFKPP
jgi:SAM-dependent methyltransferase